MGHKHVCSRMRISENLRTRFTLRQKSFSLGVDMPDINKIALLREMLETAEKQIRSAKDSSPIFPEKE